MEQVIGKIETNINKDLDLRISKYEMIDLLNNCTNIVIKDIPHGEVKNTLLQELKDLKAIVNNL